MTNHNLYNHHTDGTIEPATNEIRVTHEMKYGWEAFLKSVRSIVSR